MDKHVLYFLVMLLGSINARVDLTRLSNPEVFNIANLKRLKYILGIASGIAYTSIIIWGFFNFKWYVALLSAIAFTSLIGVVVNRGTMAGFIKIKPALDVITIIITILIWIY